MSLLSPLTGPFTYQYYTEEVPSVLAEFENEKSDPNVNSPSYITYEPSQCKELVRFRCKVTEWGDCDSDDGNTLITFSELTGTVSLQSKDKESQPPGFYYF